MADHPFQSISFYVESLWYGSLGFESVYWYRLRAQGILFLSAAVISAIALWLIFRLVTPPPGYSRRPLLQFGREAIAIPTTDALKRLALPECYPTTNVTRARIVTMRSYA